MSSRSPLLAGLLAGLLASGVASAAPVAEAPAPHPREQTLLKRQWGVEVVFVRPSAAGYMLEFRYRVLDADKARPLFERQAKPVLIDAETGARLIVPEPPTTGALRNSNPPLAGHTYWMFFANPGRQIQPGQRVDIEIGAFRAEGLIVESGAGAP